MMTGYILTGCYDGFGRIWGAAGICTPELDGHSGPVTSVCNVMPKGTEELWLTPTYEIVATASKDRTLRLWKGEAITTFVGHTQCASSVVWPERGTVYSASWDHSIRRWDVETRKNSLSMYCGKVISCIDIGGESSALIAAGGSDPVIRIWDPRKPVYCLLV
ncbi:hypothetical protein OROGR_018317 [Orobanche gracilis]